MAEQRVLTGMESIPDCYRQIDGEVFVRYGTLRAICGAVAEMVAAQQRFFKQGKQWQDLKQAKALEADVRARLRKLKAEREDLTSVGWLKS